MPPADKDAGSQGDEHVGVRRTCATASAGAFWNVAKTYEHLIRRSQDVGRVARKKAEVSRVEREQMAHSSRNGDPLDDGFVGVRLMRLVDWTY